MKVISIIYPLWNDKLYTIYTTPLMDLTGIIMVVGTSPTLMLTHAMRTGMGSIALTTIMSSSSICVSVT